MNSARLTPGRRRRLSSCAAFFTVLALANAAQACNVPVFRFALERWRPDVYRVTLLHRGPLTEVQREMLRPLDQVQDKDAANIVVRTFDVAQLQKQAENNQRALREVRDEVWSRLEKGEAWLIVQYPEHLRIEAPVFEGPLSREAVKRIVDSPVRQELIRRLVDGQTTVWVVLESGQKDKDVAAAALVESRLRELEQTLKLPELSSDPSDELLASTPLKLAFSVLRVPHGAAEELALAGTLARCEPDLLDRPDPIVFPVFGRGRALLPLIGAGINEKNIHDAAEFLVGPCSCQVKELNPGFDLLLSADWDALLTQTGQQLTAIQTRGVPPILSGAAEAELVPIPSGAPRAKTGFSESIASTTSESGMSWLMAAGLLAGVAAFVVLLAALNAARAY